METANLCVFKSSQKSIKIELGENVIKILVAGSIFLCIWLIYWKLWKKSFVRLISEEFLEAFVNQNDVWESLKYLNKEALT